MKRIAEHSPCHLCGHPKVWAGFYRWQCTNARCKPREIEPAEVDAIPLDERSEDEPPPDESWTTSVRLLLTFVAVALATFWIVREVRDRTGFYYPSMEFARQSLNAPGLGSAGVGFGQHQQEGT